MLAYSRQRESQREGRGRLRLFYPFMAQFMSLAIANPMLELIELTSPEFIDARRRSLEGGFAARKEFPYQLRGHSPTSHEAGDRSFDT